MLMSRKGGAGMPAGACLDAADCTKLMTLAVLASAGWGMEMLRNRADCRLAAASPGSHTSGESSAAEGLLGMIMLVLFFAKAG